MASASGCLLDISFWKSAKAIKFRVSEGIKCSRGERGVEVSSKFTWKLNHLLFVTRLRDGSYSQVSTTIHHERPMNISPSASTLMNPQAIKAGNQQANQPKQYLQNNTNKFCGRDNERSGLKEIKKLENQVSMSIKFARGIQKMSVGGRCEISTWHVSQEYKSIFACFVRNIQKTIFTWLGDNEAINYTARTFLLPSSAIFRHDSRENRGKSSDNLNKVHICVPLRRK